MLFGALIAARFYLAGTYQPETMNVGLGVLMTVLRLGSSAMSYRALAAVRRDDRGAALRSLAAAILLGALFVVGVAVEWSTAEFGLATAYGTAFFSTTGVHAAHMLSGMAAGDRLVLRNEDTVGHRIDRTVVAPGATVRLTLAATDGGTFLCSFQPRGSIGLDVRDRAEPWSILLAVPCSGCQWAWSSER